MFGTAFFRNTVVSVLLAATGALSAAAPADSSAAAVNATSDAVAALADGRYVIQFSSGGIARSILGNNNDIVTAVGGNIIPTPIWNVESTAAGFFTLTLDGKEAHVGADNTIALGAVNFSWAITKPEGDAAARDFIITLPIRGLHPPAGWTLPDGKSTGPVSLGNPPSVFQFFKQA